MSAAKTLILGLVGLAALGAVLEIGKGVNPAQKATERRQDASPRTATRLVIRFDELRCYNTRGGMPVVEGTLTNASDREVGMINLRFRLLSPDGALSGYAEGHAAVAPLASGQSSPFRAHGDGKAVLAVCGADSAVIRGEAAVLAGNTVKAGEL